MLLMKSCRFLLICDQVEFGPWYPLPGWSGYGKRDRNKGESLAPQRRKAVDKSRYVHRWPQIKVSHQSSTPLAKFALALSHALTTARLLACSPALVRDLHTRDRQVTHVSIN